MICGNIKAGLPDSLPEEFSDILLNKNGIKIERIISDGHSSPKDFWYDQATNEFVLLIEGRGIVEFENEDPVELNPGDYIIIPAHKRHRVAETSKTEKTIWLAVHY
jgi:cupin 2 domain-containing protein